MIRCCDHQAKGIVLTVCSDLPEDGYFPSKPPPCKPQWIVICIGGQLKWLVAMVEHKLGHRGNSPECQMMLRPVMSEANLQYLELLQPSVDSLVSGSGM